MKKFISIIVAVIMLVSMYWTVFNPLKASAASTGNTPSPNKTITITVGNIAAATGQIVMPISFSNVPVNGICAADMAITYDPTRLEYVSASAGSIVKNPVINFATNKESDGRIKAVFLDNTMSTEFIDTDGVFANLTFKVLNRPGTTPVKVTEITIGDTAMNSITTKSVSGLVSIPGPTTPTPPSVTPDKTTSTSVPFNVNIVSFTTTVGNQLDIPVRFENIPDKGLVAADMTITYDPAKLEYIDCRAGAIVKNPDVNFASNKIIDGKLRLLFLDYTLLYENINKDGDFAHLIFKVLGPSDASTSISIISSTFGDSDLNPVNATITNAEVKIIEPAVSPTPPCVSPVTPTPTGLVCVSPVCRISVGWADAYTNSTVTVPVYLTTYFKEAASCDLTITYDPNVLKYVSSKAGDIVPNPDKNLVIKKETDGKLSAVYQSSTQKTECLVNNGTFANLTFEVIGSEEESTDIKITRAIVLDSIDSRIPEMLNTGIINIYNSQPHLSVTIGSASAKTGESVTVPVNFINVPHTGIAAFDMTITYDPAKLEYISSNYGNVVINPDTNSVILKQYDGLLRVLFLDYTMMDEYIKASGVFAQLTFKALGSSESVPLGLVVNSAADINLKEISVKSSSGIIHIADNILTPTVKINVGDCSVETNKKVTVPVSLENVPEDGILVGNMTILYDPEILEYINTDAGEIVTNPTENFDVNNPSPGIVKILFLDYSIGSQLIKNDGVFANITFKSNYSTKTTKVSVSNPTIGDHLNNPLNLISQDGKVTVYGISKGYTVSGCIAPDFSITSSTGASVNSGFKVELDGSGLNAVTDSKGYFEIKDVPAGKYSIKITKANYLSRTISDVSVNAETEISTIKYPILLWAGDFEINNSKDEAINMEDIMVICKAFNTTKYDANFQEHLDLNLDGAINIEDIMIVSKHFNKISLDY